MKYSTFLLLVEELSSRATVNHRINSSLEDFSVAERVGVLSAFG
jgi:hypothetical protein